MFISKIIRIFTMYFNNEVLNKQTNKVMNNQKHTSELVSQFRHELLKRREYLIDKIDSFDDSENYILAIINPEIDKIESIFKLMIKNKL